MYIPRIADKRLARILDGDKIGVVLGARQVGKTTLVEHAVTQHRAKVLNFDIAVEEGMFQTAAALSPPAAWAHLGKPDILVLDEAQRLPAAARTVKGWYDAKLPMQIILLGSSSLDLLSRTTESLTGRNRKLRLPPLLWEEALQIHDWYAPDCDPAVLAETMQPTVRSALLERLVYGCYPEVVSTDQPRELLRELAADYLWKDLLQTGLVRNPDRIKRLLMLLAHQVGSPVSSNELATQLQLARKTVDHYIDLLEQCFVVFRLPAFSTNPRKEVSKSKKVYFWDTGIRNALLNQFSLSDQRSDIGALWENWVIAEIAKRNLLDQAPCELFFWRTYHQSELDLVLTRDAEIRAYEIKWGRPRSNPSRAFAKRYGVQAKVLTPNQALSLPSVLDFEPTDPAEEELTTNGH